MRTTPGQLIVNAALPDELRDYDRTLTADEAEKLLHVLARKSPGDYKDISHALTEIGRNAVFDESATLSLSDMQPNIEGREEMFEHARKQTAKIQASPDMTPKEKQMAIAAVYGDLQDLITKQNYEAGRQNENPFALQVLSKARGSPGQLAAVQATPGSYTDPYGNVMPVFVSHSFAEGLDPHEYWAGSFGARQGVVCLDGSTRVVMQDFTEKRIDEIRPGDIVWAADDDNILRPSPVVRIHAHGLMPMNDYTFRINASAGYTTVRCTEEHKFVSYLWKGHPRRRLPAKLRPVREARLGKKISNNNYVAKPGSGVATEVYESNDVPEALFLGLMLGDGCTAPSARMQATLSCADLSLVEDTRDYLAGLGLILVKSAGKNYNWRINYLDPDKGKRTKDLLYSLCGGCYAHDKKLPADVYSWSTKSIGDLLGGILSADGSFSPASSKHKSIRMQCTSKDLIYDMHRLLNLRLGVWCSPVARIPKEAKEWARRDQYGFSISHPDSVKKLHDIVTLVGKKKRRFSEWDVNTHSARYAPHGFRIHDIQPAGMCHAYDLEIADAGHKYMLANGMVSENSTKFCLHEDTLVLLQDYSSKPIKDLKVGDPVWTCNSKGKLIPTQVTAVCDTGLKPCREWVFGGGKRTKSVIATGEHTIYSGRRNSKNPGALAAKLHTLAFAASHEYSAILPLVPSKLKDKLWRGRSANYKRTDSKWRNLPTIDIEVNHSSHMFVLSNGLVVGNSTRDAGDLGKQFNQAAMRIRVTEDDCETTSGLPVDVNDNDTVGAELARDVGDYPAGTVVSKEVLADLQKRAKSDKRMNNEIVVRSPLTCGLGQGVCQHCVGLREDGDYPDLGDHVGITASSALAERIAQGSLNKKHASGMTEGRRQDLSGFDIINQLFQMPKQFAHRASVASETGAVEKIEEAPQGGMNITIAGKNHYVLPENIPTVKEGDTVEAGDQISDGLLNPRDVLQYKGVGEARRYMTERATKAFRDSGYQVNRRNMEALVRGLINHAEIEDGDDDNSPYLTGDIVDYSALAANYKPREDSKTLDINSSVGQYLEYPVLHHTVGTRITGRMADQLKRHGYKDVTVNSSPPSFHPHVFGLRAVPQQERDWMAQLGSSHLMKNLLKSTHRGAESDLKGLHPVPAMARSVDLGKDELKQET